MKPAVVVRRLLSLLAAPLLLGLCWWLVAGGIRNLHQVRNPWQMLETIVQLAGGLLTLGVVVTRFRWGALARRVRIAWAATQAGTGGLSALVWGPPMLHIALLFACAALLLSWALLWALGPARPFARAADAQPLPDHSVEAR